MSRRSGRSWGHGIERVAKQLQDLDQDRPVPTEAAAFDVAVAFMTSKPPQSDRRPQGDIRASYCAALTVAGWLVAAVHAAPDRATPAVTDAVQRCMIATVQWLSRLGAQPKGQPCKEGGFAAVLRPEAGAVSPGLATWLPWLAEWILRDLQAAAQPLTGDHPAVKRAMVMLPLWSELMISSNVTRDKLVHPAAWLAPPLLQLAHAVPQHSTPHSMYVLGAVRHNALVMSVHAFTLLAHPQLQQALTGRPGDEVLGAIVAEALRQEIWWDAMAACTRTLLSSGGTAARTQHPCALQLVAKANPAHVCPYLEYVNQGCLVEIHAGAVHVLLLAELWGVLPWQLQQLQAAGDVSSGGGAASSSLGVAGNGSGGGDGGSSCHTSSGGSSRGSSGSSRGSSGSSSSSSGSMGEPDISPEEESCAMLFLEVPWLPSQEWRDGRGAPGDSSPLPAVTLHQLQLSTCAMHQVSAPSMYSAALLLALLLQRADPDLRTEYLSSPWGSLMLDTLAQGPVQERRAGMLIGLAVQEVKGDMETALEGVQAFVQGVDQEEGDCEVLPAATSSLLVLAWAHLEVHEVSDLKVQDVWWSFMTTLHTKHRPHLHPLECVMTAAMPCAAFHFLPGLAPSLELFAAAERLLRAHKDLSVNAFVMAFRAIAVLLYAVCDTWIADMQLGDASRSGASGSCFAADPHSSSSSSHTTGSSSSSTRSTSSSISHNNSSGDDNGGSGGSSPDGACSPAVMQVLSSLAVSVASALHACHGVGLPEPDCSQAFLWMVRPSSLIAGELMGLAVIQLQQPQADKVAAAQLSAAAQRLAVACAEVAEQVLRVLPCTPAAARSSCSEATQHQQQQQEQEEQEGHQMNQQQEQQQEQQQGQQIEQQQRKQAEAIDCDAEDDAHQVGALAFFSLQSLRRALALLHATTCQGSCSCPNCQGVVIVPAGADAAGAQAAKADSWHPEQAAAFLLQSASTVRRSCTAPVQLVGCSNMCCANLSGPSAEGLVAGCKGVRCGGCRVARYCSPACQEKDWPQHRRVCRRLAAAAGPLEARAKVCM